jgi:multidrug efflux pump subunit AcrA (membrane-fusion protein)
MTANIKIEVSKKRDALLIPTAAVTIDPSGSTSVITDIKDTKPVYQKIETGLDQGDMVEVTKGLEEGDTIMFKGKGYRPQEAQGSNPLMPTRPNMPKGAGRAMH